ncbi:MULTISPECIES: SDR family NAD(P)-dependent oxidoreductase [Paenibacillus]|uniref:SDR family NAD(P)-dependent oxidoreductase n=1 Tax=Paenibacillus TaxID=44249 RepID=UPI00088B5F7C|nr:MULTISPECIES: SDR family NAD(P)-dependent oxidoreductase [Paenibacillus]WDQ31261.1 SDR family NAD(P)-dependent oxidoreductase [Paenibacillus marchantiae]SDK51609.1 NAD(P)-dependent dehydrogenase, short-chain alcohol dehydrogenase family [Paenibacillus sp. OK060]SEA70568.1 NAD(P)-dependent dehydrogenase, short-chain alcohol dehydrogenase family [Paenibacillus sp. 276b]SHN61088.1 NAD(P)-dependent dehydrogenase, short-chain alcohol dehydrogenase family [Paenibacillus sp. ov031]SLJ88933.1 NAD(P
MKKTAFVTGANKGIGFEIVKQLGQAGWKVVLGARSVERGEAAVTELTSEGLDIEFVQIDMSDLETIERAADMIAKDYPYLTLLINNAGMPGAFARSFTDTKEENLRSAFEVNFFGTFRLNQRLFPLIKDNEGTIVNVSTDMASLDHMQNAGFALNAFDYNSSKTANNAMTVSMAYELKSSRAQVFAVTPGFTSTDLNGNAEGGKSKEAAAAIIVGYATDGKHHNGEFLNEQGVYAW